MSDATAWFILIGILFTLVGLTTSIIRRLPMTTPLIYLLIGYVLGDQLVGLIILHPIRNSALLERLTEVVVIISLFTAGLKLRLPWHDSRWLPALRLAFLSMTLTVGLITVAGVYLLSLPLGAAVILGAVLSPTDPVLASDAQVKDPEDRDRLRFSLTGEAGLNDGTAFPFVMLGLGLLGVHDIGEYGWKWLLKDLIWATSGGLLIGFLLGTGLAKWVFHLRRRGEETILLDDFLAIGLIALSYGVALHAETYGFLAVFAAGLSLRRAERLRTGELPSRKGPERGADSPALETESASGQENEPAHTVHAVLSFNEQLERIGEAGVVIVLGSILVSSQMKLDDVWFIPLLFLGIRPLAVMLGLIRTGVRPHEKRLMSWFGIRGIGSLYYLFHAIEQGVPDEIAGRLVSVTALTVTSSVILHGISVTPIMNAYMRSRTHRSCEEAAI